jgi:hypothetical protein
LAAAALAKEELRDPRRLRLLDPIMDERLVAEMATCGLQARERDLGLSVLLLTPRRVKLI